MLRTSAGASAASASLLLCSYLGQYKPSCAIAREAREAGFHSEEKFYPPTKVPKRRAATSEGGDKEHGEYPHRYQNRLKKWSEFPRACLWPPQVLKGDSRSASTTSPAVLKQ